MLERLLPDRYDAGELPGESLAQEGIRRLSWTVFPNALLERFWRSVLLSDGRFWCFVLGVNNSGTTLLHDLLSRHEEVRTLPRCGLVAAEGQWHTNSLPVGGDHGVSRLFSARPGVFRWTETSDPAPAVRALHDWGFRYVRQSGKVLLEKSPPNAIRARWLQEHFSPARFVALFRHPCAVAEGIRRREDCEIRTAARHWAEANRTLLDDLPHLERRVVIRYEELCTDPAGTLDRIADFLSISGDLGPDRIDDLDVHSLDESVASIENFNPRSFELLSARDMEAIADEAGEVAHRLGYSIPPADA